VDDDVSGEPSHDDRSRVLVPVAAADGGAVIDDGEAAPAAPRRRKHQVSGERG
jgi:hypothetical protein